MKQFSERIQDLLNVSTNENVRTECNNLLEFVGYTSNDDMIIRQTFLSKLSNIEDTLDEKTVNFLYNEIKLLLLEEMNLTEHFNKLMIESDMVSVLPQIDYKLANLLTQFERKSAPAIYIADKLLETISPFSYVDTVNNIVTELKGIYEKYNEDILVLHTIYQLKNNQNYTFYSELTEKLSDYFFNINSNERNNILEYLNKYKYEPVIHVLTENLLKYTSTTGLNIKNVSGEHIVEDIHSFVYFEPENRHKTYFSVKGLLYERENNKLRVLTQEEAFVLPEVFKRINSYIQRPNVYINENKMVIFINETKVTFNINETEKLCYVDDKLIEGNPYETLIQSGAFNPSMYSHLNILREIWENLSTLVNLDFGKTIVMKNRPEISTTIFKIDELCHVNLSNPLIEYNQFLSNINSVQAKNAIYEFMNFDITKSLYEYMSSIDANISKLMEEKNRLSSAKDKLVEQINKVENAIKNDEVEHVKELDDLVESMFNEIHVIKSKMNQIDIEINKLSYVSEKDETGKLDDMTNTFEVNAMVKVKKTDVLGKVVSLNTTNNTVNVLLDGGDTQEFEPSELETIKD